MLKKTLNFCKNNYLYFIPLVILFIFIFSIWDSNYYIGGDLIFPLNPQNNILKSIYLWVEENGGVSFFPYMLLLWQEFFYLLSRLGVPSFLSIKIFIVLLYILSFLFSFFSYRNLFKKEEYGKNKFALLAAFLFFLNPAAILVLIGAMPLYGFPICFYFFIKYLDTNRIIYVLFFAFFSNIIFVTEGVQQKLGIVFVVGVIFLLLLYKQLRSISFRQIYLRIFVLFIFILFLDAFILVPLANDILGTKGAYNQYTQTVIVYDGNADVPSASLPFTMRFFNSNLMDKESSLGRFLSNRIFTIWTFVLWIIGLSATILIKDHRTKRVIYLLLIPLIVFIFIAKGANPPFGEVYRFLLFKAPLFKLFRTTSTVIIGGVVFFSFWLTICTYYLAQKWKFSLITLLLINILVFHPIYLGFKLENSFAGKLWQKGVSIPKEYFQMGKILDDLKDDSKVLSLPQADNYTSKTWYFGQSLLNWITKKPLLFNVINFRGILEKFSSDEACLFSSLYNIGYVIEEKDATRKVEIKQLPFLGETLINNNYFSLTKTENSCQTPQIYIPKQLVYFQGDQDNLFSIAPKLNSKQNIMVYKEINNQNQNLQFLNNADFIITEAFPQNLIFNMKEKNFYRLIWGQENYIDEVFYPYVRINPGSFLYKLVLFKEKRDEESNHKNSKKFFDKELFYATKRISEITKWGVQSEWWQENLDRYSEKINKAIELAGNFAIKRENLELIAEYIDRHQKKIENLSRTQAFWDKEKITAWKEMFKTLRNKIDKAYPRVSFSQLEYTVNTPFVNQYEAFLDFDKDQTFFDTKEKKEIFLNDSPLGELQKPALGKFWLENKTNIFRINLGQPINLINPQRWQFYNSYFIEKNSQGLLFEDLSDKLNLPKEASMIAQEISDWEPNQLYLLKINFKKLKEDSRLNLLITEKKNTFNELTQNEVLTETVPLRDQLEVNEDYQVLLKADKETLGAVIYLYSLDGKILVENVELSRVYLPKLLLTTKIKNEDLSGGAVLEYKKINPTKYKISISNAKVPFYLILSESFDRGWKVYNNQNNENILTKLNKEIFETWGQKSFAEENHVLINGYANVWYIEDISDHDLILEYEPQRFFYIGIIISIFSFIIIAGYLIFKLIRRNK